MIFFLVGVVLPISYMWCPFTIARARHQTGLFEYLAVNFWTKINVPFSLHDIICVGLFVTCTTKSCSVEMLPQANVPLMPLHRRNGMLKIYVIYRFVAFLPFQRSPNIANVQLQQSIYHPFVSPFLFRCSTEKSSITWLPVTPSALMDTVDFGQMWNNVDMASRYDHYSLNIDSRERVIGQSQ